MKGMWLMDNPTGIVLCVLTFLLVVSSAGALFVHSHKEHTRGLRWFRIAPIPKHLWEATPPLRVGRDALLAPLHIELADPAPQLWQHPTDKHVYVGVPERVATSMAFAASACGVIARECDAPPASPDKLRSLPEFFDVPGSTQWSLGLLRSGDVLALNPLPGSTVAICAERTALSGIGQGIQWLGEDFSLVTEEEGALSLRDAWESSWDRTTVRVVLCPLLPDATSALLHREELSAQDVVQETKTGILADVVLLYGSDGTAQLLHRDHRRSFSAVGRRPSVRPASPALEQPAPNRPDNPPARGSIRFLGRRGRRSFAPAPAASRQ